MIRFLLLLALFTGVAAPANALEIIGLLAGGGAVGAGLAGLTTTLGFRLLATVALTALARALAPKPTQPGIRTQFPTDGGTNPQTFILGWSASEGNRTCPDYSYGSAGGTPNAYLVKVRDFGDIKGMALGRVMINKEFVTLDATPHADLGYPVLEYRAGGTDYAWVKFYDGSQTAADPFLLATFGSDPDYPWSAGMIGAGLAYGIFTFRYNRARFSGDPSVRCEFTGIPLYDPRLDTTVGGSGAHRWGDTATYEATTNPQVMKYNILRGITLADGSVWGGEAEAEDLPLDVWFAAMNECDAVADGESAAQFQAGIEVAVDQEPADIIAELDKACLGQTFESGGVWKTRTGAPALPVYYFTDDDVVVTEEQELDPFPGLESTYNGVQATYPDPDSLWNPKEAPGRFNATWEAEDQGRRLVANIQYNAVPYPDQVQRLMEAAANEERRFRRHSLVLPPDAAILEPLDVVSWTSARNGYTAKQFELSRSADDQVSFLQAIAIRERDSDDYDWESGDMLPTTASGSGRELPVAQAVPDFAVTKTNITDGAATARRPALILSWTAAEMEAARAIRWQLRIKATAAEVASGSTHDVSSGGLVVTNGILPAVEYEARARPVMDAPTAWSSWLAATTDDTRFNYADLVGQIATDIANAAKVPVVGSLPADDTTYGAVVFLTTDAVLYRWSGAEWVATVAAAQIVGTLVAGQIGAGVIGASHISVTNLAAISATIGVLRTATSGERTEIKDDLIEVYDATDQVRVKIGDLS